MLLLWFLGYLAQQGSTYSDGQYQEVCDEILYTEWGCHLDNYLCC